MEPNNSKVEEKITADASVVPHEQSTQHTQPSTETLSMEIKKQAT